MCRRLGAGDRRSITAETPLPGVRSSRRSEGVRAPIPPHLYDLYGTRADDVVALTESAPGLRQPLSANYPDIAAQVVFSVRFEHCVRLSDFLRRRTLLGASADQGMDAARPAAELMAAELGWSRERVTGEIDAYARDVAATQAFKGDKS